MSFQRPLNDRDLELLSSYLDGELTAAERSELETRLNREPDLRRELASLRQTVALIQQTRPIRALRDFTLTPAMVRPPRVLFFPATVTFSALSAVAAFVLVMAGVVLLNLGPTLTPGIRDQVNLFTSTPVAPLVAQLPTNVPSEMQTTAVALPTEASRLEATIVDSLPSPEASIMLEFAVDNDDAQVDEDITTTGDEGADALFPPEDVNVGRGGVQEGGGAGGETGFAPPAPAPGSADLFAASEGLSDMAAPSTAQSTAPDAAADALLVEEQEDDQADEIADEQAEETQRSAAANAVGETGDGDDADDFAEAESADESLMIEEMAADAPDEAEPPLASLAQAQVQVPTEITLLPPTDTPSPTPTETLTPTPSVTPSPTLTRTPTVVPTVVPTVIPTPVPAQASPVDARTDALGIGLIVVGLVVAGIAIGAFLGRRR